VSVGFPEDRSLSKAEAGARRVSLALPWHEALPAIGGERRGAGELLAFAVLFIYSRMLQQETLCVTVVDGRAVPDEVRRVTAHFPAEARLIDSWVSAKVNGELHGAGHEIDLLICGTSQIHSLERDPHRPVLSYRVEGDNLNLCLHFEAQAMSQVSAFDLLQKIGLILTGLSERPNLLHRSLELITRASAAFIPDPSKPIKTELFDFLPTRFLQIADRYPHELAITGCSSHGGATEEREYTYANLKCQTIVLANRLINSGVVAGDVVAVMGFSSFGTVAGMLAALMVGAVIVMIDRKLPEQRQRQIAEISQPRAWLAAVEDESAGSLPLGAIVTDAWPDARSLIEEPAAPIAPWQQVNSSAYLFFTSGSTGLPKGVLGRHQGLAHFLDWQRRTFPIGPGDRTAQLTALSFDVVLRDLFYPLTSGACIHIPARETLLDARRMLHWIAKTRITVMHCVPSLMKAWLMADPGTQPFRTLKHIFFAGEPLSDQLLERFRAAAASNTHITNLYGPTETTLAKLWHSIERIESGIQPVGRPQPGVDVLIVRDRQVLCGLWEVGEIAIRTPYRSNGYFQNPELTRQAFQPNPMREDPEDLIYYTGDLGRFRSDGRVEIFGRIDAQIKIRGVRIEPTEIEACLLSQPGIRDAAVTTRLGANDDKMLFAVVVTEGGIPGDQAGRGLNIREALRARLHDAMVPARILFRDQLPYLPNGKLDRKTLALLNLEPGNDPGPVQDPTEPLDPKLARIVHEIEATLGLRAIHLDDSFISLGGDSLSYIRVSLTIEDVLGYLPEGWEQMPLRRLTAGVGSASKPMEESVSNSWRSIETPIVFRAISIMLVVLSHATRFNVIGTSTLFVISGMSFGKFFRPDLMQRPDLRPVLTFILRFAVPAAVWQLMRLINGVTSFWLPDFLLMGTYFADTAHPHWTFWFLDVLAANILVLALITQLWGLLVARQGTGTRRFTQDFAGSFALVLVGLGVSFAQVGMHWWDGDPGRSSVGPFKWFWMLAFGVAVTQARSRGDRLWLSALLSALAIATYVGVPGVAGSFSELDAFFFVASMMLIWMNRIPIPRLLRRPLVTVASSSLFIYIVNKYVIQRVHAVLKSDSAWPLEILLAIGVGIVYSSIWTRVEAWARVRLRRAA
jgi:amino acid adenylation domain-containing protein